MTEVKLLSIKRSEEASYFYENGATTAFDTNSNGTTPVEENPKTSRQISKKERKDMEKQSKKEKKQKIKEIKQREKEKRKSLKNSRKEVVGSVDTGGPSKSAAAKVNGDVKVNGGLQVGMNSNEEEMKDDHDESTGSHDGGKSEEEESREDSAGIVVKNEDSLKQEEVSDKHESSTITTTTTTITTQEELTPGNVVMIAGKKTSSEQPEKLREVEETIVPDEAKTTHETPADIFYQPTLSPHIPESTGSEHVEIEISEVTDFEANSSSSGQVVVVEHIPQNNMINEGQIHAVTVQQVESGVDLDTVFATCDDVMEEEKEEKRKSVRFQEETEEITEREVEPTDHEHASYNFGGDFTSSNDDASIEPSQKLEPAIEVVSKEERKEVIACVNVDRVLASSEQETNDTEQETIDTETERNDTEQETIDTETDLVQSNVNVVKVNGNGKVNGQAMKTETNDMVEISLNESNEYKNTAKKKKKEKNERSRLMRCCFP